MTARYDGTPTAGEPYSLIAYVLVVEDGQKLYVRLFLRKRRWIPKSKIIYSDIASDLSSILDHVTSSGLFVDGMCCGLYNAHVFVALITLHIIGYEEL